MPASETLLSKLENLLNGLTILGGTKEQTTILPNAIVINDAPSGLADYIIVRDPRDGNYITAVKVAGMAYVINDYVNLLFVKGTEPIAFQHGSNSPSGGFKVYQVWESDFGAVALQADATGNIGIGIAIPATKLDIDTGSNTAGLRLRGLAETTEIADLYVGSGGHLIIDLTAGAAVNQFVDIRTEDDQFGLIIRESDGTGTAVYANFHVTDAATDYLNIVVSQATTTLGLVITEDERVGIRTSTVPHGGIGAAMLALDGANGSTDGPHQQWTTTTDDYPVGQLLIWSHDNWQLLIDCYYDGGSDSESSDAGSNFRFIKNADMLLIQGDTGIAQGSNITWDELMAFDPTNKNVGIGIASGIGAKLHVDQPSTTASIPTLTLDQADLSEEFIRFIGTSTNGVLTQSIVDNADIISTTLVGWLKFYVQDDGNQLPDAAYYMPFYSIA